MDGGCSMPGPIRVAKRDLASSIRLAFNIGYLAGMNRTPRKGAEDRGAVRGGSAVHGADGDRCRRALTGDEKAKESFKGLTPGVQVRGRDGLPQSILSGVVSNRPHGHARWISMSSSLQINRSFLAT
jgi:hypothetical protein